MVKTKASAKQSVRGERKLVKLDLVDCILFVIISDKNDFIILIFKEKVKAVTGFKDSSKLGRLI
jgi:hypothetical protein